MTKRIFRSIFFVSALTLIVTVVLTLGIMQIYFKNQLKAELAAETSFVAQGVEKSGCEYFYNIRISNRITWVADDGAVLFDSAADENTLENHGNREEIKEAYTNGTGFSERYSSTLSEKTVNYAVALSDGSVIRISSKQYTVWVILAKMSYLLLFLIAGILLLSVILSKALARKIVQPINKIDLEAPDIDEDYDELSPLLHKINRQNNLITRQMTDLKRRQEEFRTITENMSEGFLLIDTHREVLSFNTSVLKLLGTSDIPEESVITVLSRNSTLNTAIDEALSGIRYEALMNSDNKIYQLFANPVTVDERISGAVLVILDVTEKEQREAMRREFTSNVSHELKTPLTSIYGISEIMKNGIVKPEDITGFAENIHEESGRLITLVNDIIKISQLDENSVSAEKQPINLYLTAKTVLSRLKAVAASRNIELRLDGTDTEIIGIPAIIEEMLYNLCDNAIKYNKESGSISVSTDYKNGHPQISVEDTGIGIPKEHIDRIFERFYCVDKSHSKAIGGTGLGLSIVKHAANFHNAEIKVSSTVGIGTKITVIF